MGGAASAVAEVAADVEPPGAFDEGAAEGASDGAGEAVRAESSVCPEGASFVGGGASSVTDGGALNTSSSFASVTLARGASAPLSSRVTLSTLNSAAPP